MKYSIFLPILVFLTFSCTEDTFIQDTREVEDDKIEFLSIEYFVDGNYKETIESTLDTTYFENNTDISHKMICNPFADLYDSSLFSSSNDLIFFFTKKNNLHLKIPIYIDHSSMELSDDEWLFSNRSILREPHIMASDTTIFEPHDRVGILYRIVRHKYKANFKLRYKNVDTNKEGVMEGKWEGSYLVGYTKDVYVVEHSISNF